LLSTIGSIGAGTWTQGGSSGTLVGQFFNLNVHAIVEGQVATIYVNRFGDASSAHTVQVRLTSAFGINGQDFPGGVFADPIYTVNFAAGQNQQTITFATADDGFTEGTNFLRAEFTFLGGAAAGSRAIAILQIDDNDLASPGDDILLGSDSDDRISGLAGNDTITGGAGKDEIDGGNGIDEAAYLTSAVGVTVDLTIAGTQDTGAGLDMLTAIENLSGSDQADTLTGDGGANVLRGWGSADTLFGGAGTDTLDGGFGNDNMAGGANNDSYAVDSPLDTVSEALNEGIDTVNAAFNSYSLFAVANVERIVFTGSGNFTGRGNALDNRIQGAGGNDRFVSDQGGADRYFGDLGSADQMDFRPSATGAIVNLTTGIHGGAASGDLFSSIEYFYGSDTAADNFTGAAFNDRFDGYGGNDTLIGAGGNDTINGGNGDDEISGGALFDTLTGNAGADDFNYAALTDSNPTAAERDRILDFAAGIDDIDVSAIDARAGSGGNNAFTAFIGAAAFTAEGQVRWYQSGLNTVVEFNTAGASGAEMQIQLNNFNAATLAQSDFIA
jgi:Ca2+-binding RTX toxin-like protein